MVRGFGRIAASDSFVVALTGATGFIGRQLQHQLLDSGYEIRAFVRPSSAHFRRIDPRCKIISTDLSDRDALVAGVAGADAVVYCAGSTRGASYDDFLAANVIGVENISYACRQVGPAPPLLLISSLAASRPQISFYARSKYAGEQVVVNCPDLAWTIFRPPPVYGPGDTEMLPLLTTIRKGLLPLLGPAGQRLSLLYVDDLGRAVIAWLKNLERCREKIFAIDDGAPQGYDWDMISMAVAGRKIMKIRIPRLLLSVIAAVNVKLAKVFRYLPMLSPGKVQELCQETWLCCNVSFIEATGWRPEIDLYKGTKLLFGTKK